MIRHGVIISLHNTQDIFKTTCTYISIFIYEDIQRTAFCYVSVESSDIKIKLAVF